MRAVLLLAVLLLGCAASVPTLPAIGESKVPGLRLPLTIRPLAYAIELRVDPSATSFSGKEVLRARLEAKSATLWLHARGLRISQATAQVGGKVLEGKLEQVTPDGLARLDFAEPLPAGQLELHFVWSADFAKNVIGFFTAKEAGESYAVTDLEATEARSIFPGFDEPMFKTPFQLTAVVPERLVAVSNTAVESELPADAGFKRMKFGATAPLPTYLFALAVGPFAVVERDLPPNEIRTHALHVRYFAPKGRSDELGAAIDAGEVMVPWLERYFGVPFPYAKLDHLVAPGSTGGMENAAMIRYDEGLLYKESQPSPSRRARIAGLLAHETAHQWFGDDVTSPWWDEIWLNEAFADWIGSRAVSSWKPERAGEIELLDRALRTMQQDSLAHIRVIREPITSAGEIDAAFDSITYVKGAAVIGMFEEWIGAEPFRRGLHEYLASHAGGLGSTDALLDAWSRASGREIKAPFKTFLDQPGVPLVEMSVSCAGNKARATLQQSRYLPLGSSASHTQLWQIPICARMGIAGETKEACTLLEAREGALDLPGCPDWIFPNAEGHGYYRFALAPHQLQQLLGALKQLSARERLALANNVQAALDAGALSLGDALSAMEQLAGDEHGEVVAQTVELFEQLIERGDDQQRARARVLAAQLYRPIFARLGFAAVAGEPPDQARLRGRLGSLLALKARDPSVRAEAVKRARALLSPNPPKIDHSAVAPALAAMALAVAMEEGDAAFFDQLLARLKQTEAESDRALLLGALNSARPMALSDRALGMLLDGSLKPRERFRPVAEQMSEPETRENAWAWLTAHWDALLPVMPTFTLSPTAYLAESVADFCEPAQIERARGFFEEKVAKVPDARRSLELSIEQARICSAQRTAQGAERQRLLR